MPSSVADTSTRLQYWYAENCNGDWEHLFGVDIGTLDNPGWRIEVDLAETIFTGLTFPTFKTQSEHNEHVWLIVKSDKDKVVGYCGPLCLSYMIDTVISAIESQGRSLETLETNGFWDHRRVP